MLQEVNGSAKVERKEPKWNSPEFGGSEKRNLIDSYQKGSMSKSQPTYTKEFKQQAVTLFETSGKSKTQIARDLGISDSALSKWCKEFGVRVNEELS
ncbi:transposase [Ktedonobacteria bacterium brp13]|nr:transposase [Ktedonobacteria bacterium brp13]